MGLKVLGLVLFGRHNKFGILFTLLLSCIFSNSKGSDIFINGNNQFTSLAQLKNGFEQVLIDERTCTAELKNRSGGC